MSAAILDLADAVTARINALPELLGQPAVRRFYLPTWTIEELTELRIAVIPTTQTISPLDRHRDAFEYAVQVAITQHVTDLDAIDALMLLVEEIIEAFRPGILEDYHGLRCVLVQNAPLYDPELLESEHVFNALLTLTYRAGRERAQ
jgi:hypothetical protein